jgi:hypothetical protein
MISFLTAMVLASVDPATQLAQRVYERAGGPSLKKVAELRFSFVVYKKTEKVMEAVHRWDLRHSRDRVTWKDRKGVERDAVVDLKTRAAKGTLDKKPPSEADAKELGEKTYARWVNDSYWLMLPLKLLDPGVHRALEEKREHAGKQYDILKLSFDHVGLTPGDQYWLFIDPDTNEIARWTMQLEGEKGPPEGNSFADYRAVGPLRLALDHVTDDGAERIALENVEALEAVNAEDFSIP